MWSPDVEAGWALGGEVRCWGGRRVGSGAVVWARWCGRGGLGGAWDSENQREKAGICGVCGVPFNCEMPTHRRARAMGIHMGIDMGFFCPPTYFEGVPRPTKKGPIVVSGVSSHLATQEDWVGG